MGKRWNLIRRGWGVEFVPKVSAAELRKAFSDNEDVRKKVQADMEWAMARSAKMVLRVREHETAEALAEWGHWWRAYRALLDARAHATAALTLATRPELAEGYVALAGWDPLLEEVAADIYDLFWGTYLMLEEEGTSEGTPDVGVGT